MERRRRLRSTGRGLTLNRTAFSFFSCFPHLFFPVISLASRTARLEPSARARRAPTHCLSSFPATTKRLREQLASLRARATGRCLRGLRSSKCIQSPLPDSTHASYPRRKPFGLAQGLSLDLRSILSPFASFGISSVRPALFTSRPQKPGLPVAHASVTFCNTRHRLSLASVTSSLTASRSLASAPLTPKKIQKTMRAWCTKTPGKTADFPTTQC